MNAFRSNDNPMFVLHVDGMASRRVAGVVTRAVKAFDRGAIVRADHDTRRLDIEPSSSDADDLIQVLAAAGFAATVVASAADSAFAWADSRDPVPIVDGRNDESSVPGARGSRGLLPEGALGPLSS